MEVFTPRRFERLGKEGKYWALPATRLAMCGWWEIRASLDDTKMGWWRSPRQG
jgi:hypothetical protein